MAVRRIPRDARVCYIYVMESAGLLKVGWSEDPAERIRDLQTGSPLPLRLVHVVPCPSYAVRKIEQAAHKALAPYNIRGEWHDAEVLLAVAAIHDAFAACGQRVLSVAEVGKVLAGRYLASEARKGRGAVSMSVAKARVADLT